MRIVIADDAVVLRTLLRRLLEEAGHAVVGEVADGTDALASVGQLSPDAILIDGRLPPHGAVHAIERLRRDDAGAAPAIYVVAALDERELVRTALAAGARGIVLRPFLRSQIVEMLGSRA